MMSIHQIRTLYVIIGLLLFAGVATVVQAQAPQTINFQGYLTDTAGAPITGNRSMIFLLYPVATGGSNVWHEIQTVTVINGVYNVVLGSVTPITVTVPGQYYLGVVVGDDPEMTPRTALTSVMSALMLRDVTLNGGNTFVGQGAGNATTTGYANTFVGQGTGNATTTGSDNTFIGVAAGSNNTTGADNTFVGVAAGQSNSAGYDNTFLGMWAGSANTTGHDNTFVGYAAGNSTTTGFANTFLGKSAGRATTTGSYNTFVGQDAGYAKTTGHYNTFIGYAAGNANTTGSDNTFVGMWAGHTNTTGRLNTFVGEMAGDDNTTGHNNTFLGFAAGAENTTGYANTFLGTEAGRANDTGMSNVFLGYAAGYAETGSNRLYIANSDTMTPLIYGEFDNNRLRINGNLEVTGTAAKPGGGAWSTLSDQRLKDVQGQFSRGLEALAPLQPVAYRYKAGNPLNLPSDATYIGLIAQEVQPVIPEAVGAGRDGYLTLNSDPILWTMLNAIKQLQAENQALRQEVEALKARLNP